MDPAQRKTRRTSTVKTSILEKNDITPTGIRKMKRKCQVKPRTQNNNYVR